MKWDKIVSCTVAIVGSAANYLWGGWDVTLKTLLLFMLLDYILGVMCGIKNKKLSSQIAFKGIFKKITILVILAVAVNLDCMTNAGGLMRGLVCFYYIGLEGISILENAGEIGVLIPEKLRDTLAQLKKDGDKIEE